MCNSTLKMFPFSTILAIKIGPCATLLYNMILNFA